MDLFATLYLVFILGGGSPPDITIIPHGTKGGKRCEEMARSLRNSPPDIIDQVSGRIVLSRFYKCVPPDPVWEIERLQQLSADELAW